MTAVKPRMWCIRSGGLQDVPGIIRVIGHGKGSLAIPKALRSLPRERTQTLAVLTNGRVIAEERTHDSYAQFLGLLDGPGVLNSWGISRSGDRRSITAPTLFAFSMPLAALVEDSVPTAGARRQRARIAENASRSPRLAGKLLLQG